VQFVLNYEEGGENCVLHGDAASETFLSEIVGAVPFVGARHMSMESLYEYGSRAGVWRVLKLFRERRLPITVFGIAMALERNPLVAETVLKDGHEICSHGYRWINYHGMPIEQEREHMRLAIEIQKRITGSRPLGWYTGRTSENTRALVAEEGGFLYDADDYSDDLPFWSRMVEKPHLVVPYTLDTNDMRFAAIQGFNSGDQYFTYMKDAFDTLYEEGAEKPRMMSVGLHCRLIGKPARFQALKRFVDYALSHDKVWVARRVDIARHWRTHHPPA
jgi:putative urate catabolism protein